jgi:hypothetical protein
VFAVNGQAIDTGEHRKAFNRPAWPDTYHAPAKPRFEAFSDGEALRHVFVCINLARLALWPSNEPAPQLRRVQCKPRLLHGKNFVIVD